MTADVATEHGLPTLEEFEGCSGDAFTVHVDETTAFEVALVEVAPGREISVRPGETLRRRPFSLLFRSADPTSYVPQRLYDLEHERLGEFTLFLVPVGPDQMGMRYEAVFT